MGREKRKEGVDFARAEGVAPRAAPSPSIHLASTRPPLQRRTLTPREYLVSSHTLARCEAADITVPLSLVPLARPHHAPDIAFTTRLIRVPVTQFERADLSAAVIRRCVSVPRG